MVSLLGMQKGVRERNGNFVSYRSLVNLCGIVVVLMFVDIYICMYMLLTLEELGISAISTSSITSIPSKTLARQIIVLDKRRVQPNSTHTIPLYFILKRG